MITMSTAIFLALIGAILNRLRGGLFTHVAQNIGWTWATKQRTTTMRLIWAVPTGLLLWHLTGQNDWFWAAFIASSFAGYAMLGHGAHMVYRIDEIHEFWRTKPFALQTELTTRWLPFAFGENPNALWSERKLWTYHMIGMSFIGLIRSAIMLSPIWWTEATFSGSLALVLSGLLLGPLYWLGGRIQGSQAAELLVGALYWFTFYGVLGLKWL
jgi:hypothetical protein